MNRFGLPALKERMISSDYRSNIKEYRKISLTFYLIATGFLAVTTLGIVYWMFDFNEGLSYALLAWILCFIMFFMMWKGVSAFWVGNVCAGSVILNLSPLIGVTGGIWSPALIWLIYAPISGYMLANHKSGIFWSIVTFFTIGFFLGYEIYIGSPESFIESPFAETLLTLNMILVTATLLSIVVAYEKDQERSLISMERLNASLRRKSEELKSLNQSLEERVKLRTSELEHSNAELDYFAYSISHNLRAPLASIIGLTSIAKPDDAEIEEYLELIKGSADKLDKTIHGINSYLKQSKSDREYEMIRLWDLVSEVWKELSYMPNAKKISIGINDQSLIFKSDKERLRIIILNLLSNAIKYIDESKSEHRIQLEVSGKDGGIELKVFDNGIGIEEENREKVFKMFFRATANSSGDGLGLYIVRETVKRLGGKIDIIPEKISGTCFRLFLPTLV